MPRLRGSLLKGICAPACAGHDYHLRGRGPEAAEAGAGRLWCVPFPIPHTPCTHVPRSVQYRIGWHGSPCVWSGSRCRNGNGPIVDVILSLSGEREQAPVCSITNLCLSCGGGTISSSCSRHVNNIQHYQSVNYTEIQVPIKHA